MHITETTIGNILTRTTGFLRTVTSHSLQPYRGCSFGNALCGVGCYVQHNQHILAGRPWGSFLEVRTNAADSYRQNAAKERRWSNRRGDPFGIFCSSATDPFVPQEFKYGVTRSVLEAMCDEPPDLLILQTHSHRVADYLPLIQRLKQRCQLRVHISIESDRETLPSLPPPASSVEKRLAACKTIRDAGIFTVVTVSPLLPIADPPVFFPGSPTPRTLSSSIISSRETGAQTVLARSAPACQKPCALSLLNRSILPIGSRWQPLPKTSYRDESA